MNKSNFRVLLLLFLFSIQIAEASKIPTFDLQKFIDLEIRAGKKTIYIPKGRFRVNPQHRVHLRLDNLSDITIDGTGVEMICSQTTRAISINNCQKLTIRGLTIDYDPLCFTQGVISAMASDKSYIDVQLQDGYPTNISTRMEVFNPETKLLRRHTYYGWQNAKKIDKKTYRFTKIENYKYNSSSDFEQIGDIVVINSEFAPDGMIPHAIHSDSCTNLRLENITVYSGPTFAFLETNGNRNTYYRCTVDRRPETTDYIKRFMRYRSNNADAFHSKFAFVGPQIIECSAQFQGDDGVNICGAYYLVLTSQDGVIRVASHREMDIRKGASLDCISYSGERVQNIKVLDVRVAGSVNPNDIEFIKKCSIHEKVQTGMLNSQTKVYELVLDKADTGLNMGSVISDANRTGSGFLVKNCNFSNNRSRGILIKASNGSVVGNTLNGNWLQAILVSPEAFWLESGCSDNVEITENKISDNLSKECILIGATCMDRKTPKAGIHQNISLKNNELVNCPVPQIKCIAVKGLILENNSIDKTIVDGEKCIQLVNCER